MSIELIAWIGVACCGVVVLFQLALAAGAPWGKLAMGGKFPGRFPPQMRIAAVVQALLLLFFAVIILSSSGLYFQSLQSLSRTGIWVVAGLSIISSVMNLLTPSKWERIIWAPVALTMSACSFFIALN